MRPYYTDLELLRIAQHCNSFNELHRSAKILVSIILEEGQLNLKQFEGYAHKRIRELANQNEI